MSFSLYDLSFFDGANAVAVMVSYYDASEIGDHLALGGLLFRKKNIRPFEKRWRAMLRRHGISHFHMTDCNADPPRGPFKDKTKDECIACASEAIGIILEFATKGVIYSVSKSLFNEVVGPKGFMPNPFTLGVWYALFDIRNWADKNDPIARIAYVFESGDEHQRDAEHLLSGVAEEAPRATAFRYDGHAFLPKRQSLPTQAADILAWHGAKQADRFDRGFDRLRGDFDAIVSRLHVTDGTHDHALLQHLVKLTQRLQDKPIAGSKIKPEHWSEFVRLSFLMNEANARRSLARAAQLLERDG